MRWILLMIEKHEFISCNQYIQNNSCVYSLQQSFDRAKNNKLWGRCTFLADCTPVFVIAASFWYQQMHTQYTKQHLNNLYVCTHSMLGFSIVLLKQCVRRRRRIKQSEIGAYWATRPALPSLHSRIHIALLSWVYPKT